MTKNYAGKDRQRIANSERFSDHNLDISAETTDAEFPTQEAEFAHDYIGKFGMPVLGKIIWGLKRYL